MRYTGHFFTLTIGCIALLFVLQSSAGYAQFDLGKVKKKAKEVLSKDSDDGKEQEGREAAGENSTSSSSSSIPILKEDEGRQARLEMLKEADFAIRPVSQINSVYSGMLAQKKEAQNFYDACKKADYPNRRAQVEKMVQEDPGLLEIEEYRINSILKDFLPHFESLTNEYLIREINNAIETAYSEKAKGPSRAGAALEAAEAALLTAEAVLLVTPDNTKAQTLRDDARTAAEGMGAALASAVYTGPFHQEHAGQIVFSSSPITAGQENTSAIKTAFTANDDIYGMMYFKGTYKEVTGGGSVAHTRLLVDGNEMVSYVFKLNAEESARSWLKSEIVPDPALSTTRGAQLFTEKLKDLSPRRHTVIVRTTDDYGTTIAEGEFSLDCSGGLDRMAEVYRKLGEKKLSSVALPAPAMRNAALENEMMAALGEWNPKKPIKVIITDRDWTIQHHPVTGAIVSRTINTTTVFKLPDGSCRFFEISYKQQYAGGKYGKAQQYGVGDSGEVLCDKVK